MKHADLVTYNTMLFLPNFVCGPTTWRPPGAQGPRFIEPPVSTPLSCGTMLFFLFWRGKTYWTFVCVCVCVWEGRQRQRLYWELMNKNLLIMLVCRRTISLFSIVNRFCLAFISLSCTEVIAKFSEYAVYYYYGWMLGNDSWTVNDWLIVKYCSN